MSRNFDGEKIKLWRERFRRHTQSTQTVEDFCRSEGVSVPTFYQWRKKLALSPRKRPSEKRPAFRAVIVKPDPPLSAAAALSVRLPSGAKLQVPRESFATANSPGQLEVVRVVVAELVRAGQGLVAGDDQC